MAHLTNQVDVVVHLTPGRWHARPGDRAWIVSGLVGGSVLVFGAVVRVISGGQDAATFALALAVGVLVVAALFGYAELRLRNATVYIKGERVGVTSAFGTRSEVALSAVDHLERVTLSPAVSGRGQVSNVLRIVTRDGRSALAFDGGDRLDRGGLERLREKIGVPITGTWSE